MKELSRRMARIEQRMQPAKGKQKITVIYDDNPNAADLEREAAARGDKVILVMFADPRAERPATR